MAERDNTLLLVLAGAGVILFLKPDALASIVGGISSLVPAALMPGPAPGTGGVPATVSLVPNTSGDLVPVVTTSPIATVPTVAPMPFVSPLPVAAPQPIILGGPTLPAADTTLQEVQTIVQTSLGVVKSSGTIVQQTGITTIQNLGTIMQVVGVVELVVDMGFIIAGNAPDAQKAIDTALDAAMIVCLFIPVYGWIIAIVLAVVRFIFDLFAGKLFGSLTHAQREALETARYAEHLHPIFPAIAQCYSPRELLRVLIAWGSGSCGGVQSVAMVTGLHNTPGPGDDLYFGDETCYYHTGPNAGITFDEQAWQLATRGQTSDFFAAAQAGIATQYLDAFDAQMFNVVTARCVVYANMAAQGLTLDDMDRVASEYRRADTLNRVASMFGWDGWHTMFAAILQPYWSAYVATRPEQGSLNDFARSLGYADSIALRDAAFSGYTAVGLRVIALEDAIRSFEVELSTSPTLASMFVGKGPSLMPTPMPGYTPDQSLLAYLQALEARQTTLAQACAQSGGNPYGSGPLPGSTGGP